MCGFGAITFAAGWPRHDPATALLTAGLLIFLAMLFDGLDGAAARWTGHSSEFGAKLDSLCDAISFGAAPALLMIELARPVGYHPRVVWVVAALYVACAVLRLARFGAETADHEPGVFQGLPSPAAAAVVASVPILLFGPQVLSGEWPPDAWLDTWATRVLPVATLGVAALMVSRVRYRHVFHRLARRRRSRGYVLGVVFAAAVIAAAPRVAVPLLAGWYAFAPPALALWGRHLRGRPLTPGEHRRASERTPARLASESEACDRRRTSYPIGQPVALGSPARRQCSAW